MTLSVFSLVSECVLVEGESVLRACGFVCWSFFLFLTCVLVRCRMSVCDSSSKMRKDDEEASFQKNKRLS